MADTVTVRRPAAIEAIAALIHALDRYGIEESDWEATEAIAEAVLGLAQGLNRG